jgi:hypothetical protein
MYKQMSPLSQNGTPGFLQKLKTQIKNKLPSIIGNVIAPVAFSSAKAILNEGKKRIYNNINPRGYQVNTAEGSPLDPAERIFSALKGVPEDNSVAGNDTIKGQYYESQERPANEERKKLFGQMLGQLDEKNSLPVSNYRPSNSVDESAKYHSSPVTESYIGDEIKNNPKFFDDFIWEKNSTGDPKTTAYHMNAKYGNVLGDYTMNMGEDKKGKYVSYYDKWDLDPFGADTPGATPGALAGKTGGIVQKMLGIKPTELYGRVYY